MPTWTCASQQPKPVQLVPCVLLVTHAVVENQNTYDLVFVSRERLANGILRAADNHPDSLLPKSLKSGTPGALRCRDAARCRNENAQAARQ